MGLVNAVDKCGPKVVLDPAKMTLYCNLEIHNPETSKMIVFIKNDGTLEYGENYEPDKAAQIFWEALGRKFKESSS